MRDEVAQTPDELLKWIKNLNPGLHTKNWGILDNRPEPKGQRLILHIDWDSFLFTKRTRYKIFTGLSQGTVKVLRDPEAQHQKEEAAVLNAASSEFVSEGKEMEHPLPQMTGEEQQKQKRRFLLASDLPQQIRGPL
jgi:hypothetical protein